MRKLELGQVAGERAQPRAARADPRLAAGHGRASPAVFIQRQDQLSNVSLTYGAIFLGLCLGAHMFLRVTLPHADPYLFPLVALLACFGLVVIYRIDETLAREQAQWFVLGLVLFTATIVFLRDYRVLERYRYLIAFASIALLLMPRLPGIGAQVNGAYLAVRVGPIQFQPAEFAKIAIVIFLASYLRDTRQVLVLGARRIPGRHAPAAQALRAAARGVGAGDAHAVRDPGPRLVADVLRRLPGAALRRHQPAVVRGHRPDAVRRRRVVLRNPHRARARAYRGLAAPVRPQAVRRGRAAATRSPSRSSPRPTAACSAAASARRCSTSRAAVKILPAAHTDLIYAVITNELGLVGACGVLLTYLLIVERGFKIALLARDSFSTLLATGLTAVFALQVFVIVGGVTKVIPLTGVTLPFVSYGGSSIVANFVLLALLLLVSDRARRPA